MGKILLIFVAFLILCGLVYQGIVSIYGDPLDFAKQTTTKAQEVNALLASALEAEAQADKAKSEADKALFEYLAMTRKQEYEKAKAETVLIYAGVAGITILSIGVAILVLMIVLQYKRSNPRKMEAH